MAEMTATVISYRSESLKIAAGFCLPQKRGVIDTTLVIATEKV